MKHFNEQISKAKTIAITGHIHPDGDCIGSCLALKQYILDNYSGKKVDVYLESISTEFRFLSHAQEIITESKDDESYDLFFVLDCGSEDRYEPFAAMVRCAKTLIGIDHHISNDGFGDFYKIDPQASATCEVLCQIFEEDKISKECASAYTQESCMIPECLSIQIQHVKRWNMRECYWRRVFQLQRSLMRHFIRRHLYKISC
mgnify:FL=1